MSTLPAPGRWAATLRKINGSLDRFVAALLSRLDRLTRQQLFFLFAVGLAVRLAGAFLHGTQDMEFWKAFGTHSIRHGLIALYGVEDRVIQERRREGGNGAVRLPEGLLVRPTQTLIRYQPHKYFRTEYTFVQPPLYIYPILLSTGVYSLLDPELAETDSRWFNFFLNLPQIAASALITLLILGFARMVLSPSLGVVAALLYWLNPVTVLNSPVQGFLDPVVALCAATSVVLAYRQRLAGAYVFLVLAFLYKPQGILIAPVIIWVGLRQHNTVANLRAWLAAGATSALVFLPYILWSRMLSVVQGVLSITQSSHDLSRQSMNIWWPVQYAYNAVHAVRAGDAGVVSATLGGRFCWQCDVPAENLRPILGFDVRIVGFLLLAIFTVINLWYVSHHARDDRKAIVIAAGLQVYAYFILQVGVQNNHYFALIPLFALVCCASAQHLKGYLAISAVLFAQDFLFYGLGRDLTGGAGVLSLLHLGWTTNVLAFTNVGLFAYLCAVYYRVLPPFQMTPANKTSPHPRDSRR